MLQGCSKAVSLEWRRLVAALQIRGVNLFPAQRAARERAVVAAILDDNPAVDDDVLHPGREQSRLFIRGAVGDSLFIEHDYVRVITFANQSTLGDVKSLGRERAAVLNCEGQADDLLFVDVLAQL